VGPVSAVGGWRCPRWCTSADHQPGRHSHLVDTVHLTGNVAAPEVVAVALVQRIGGHTRIEIIRDTGEVLGVLGLSLAEGVKLHRMLVEALVTAGALPETIALPLPSAGSR